jgi:hypothetical protein
LSPWRPKELQRARGLWERRERRWRRRRRRRRRRKDERRSSIAICP